MLVQYCLYLVLSVVLDASGSDMVVHNWLIMIQTVLLTRYIPVYSMNVPLNFKIPYAIITIEDTRVYGLTIRKTRK